MTKLVLFPQTTTCPVAQKSLSCWPTLKTDLDIIDNEISKVFAKSKNFMNLGSEELPQCYLPYYVQREVNPSHFKLFSNHLRLTLYFTDQ